MILQGAEGKIYHRVLKHYYGPFHKNSCYKEWPIPAGVMNPDGSAVEAAAAASGAAAYQSPPRPLSTPPPAQRPGAAAVAAVPSPPAIPLQFPLRTSPPAVPPAQPQEGAATEGLGATETPFEGVWHAALDAADSPGLATALGFEDRVDEAEDEEEEQDQEDDEWYDEYFEWDQVEGWGDIAFAEGSEAGSGVSEATLRAKLLQE